MMIVSPTPVFRWTDNNGNPAVGWQVETYIAGSSTPVDTYTDATGTAENTNPIILDARGEANIWLDPAISYKYVIKNNLGVIQDTIDQIQAGSGGSGGLTRVYYNDSSSIAFSGLGTLATPLSSAVKLSAQPNNALQVRADGLYAMAIGGGGSVAWGSITGNILSQTDLINKFGEYLPLTFASPQIATYTDQSQYVFANAGEFVAQNLAVGSAQNNFVSLKPFDLSVRFVDGANAYDSLLTLATLTAGRTWTLPDADGTIALASQIPSVADYIKKDGTTTTTATIPFAQGASFGDAPSGLAIQLTGASKWIGSGTSPTTGGSALLLDSTSWILRSNTGNTISTSTNNITYNNNAGSHIFQASGSNLYSFNSSVHSWDGGIGGSSAKYQFNGSVHIASTLRIGSIPTGTQVGLVGYDANGNLIQGSGGGGSYVTLSGHNDITTPWSIGDASTWNSSSAGMRIDPVGAYGVEIKGNVQIEQAVSQALNLYRPVASGDICLNFRAWDSLGTASDYAQVCGRIVSNTAGSLASAIDFKVMVNGTTQTPMTLSNAGTVLSLHTSVSGSQISLRSSDTGAGGWRMGIRSTTAGEFILVNDNLSTIPLIVSRTDDSFTFAGAVLTSASTTTRAGLRIPHGTAPSSPVNGDLWTTTTAVLARINGTTRTFGLLGVANDWATIQTARGFAVTGQTNTPTGTTYTWTLTSGNQLDITLTSSTGDVTITTASPSAGAYSILSATGHGTLARNLIITQSGVTFIMTGKTSGNSITLDSIPATKRACYILYWITTAKCFIDRVTLEA